MLACVKDTIVVYYSDHGGILPRGKRYIYDTGTHVPMIARFPKKWAHLAPGKPGTTSDRPVSFIDLPPTALSLARVDIPEHMQGRAFLGQGKREAEPYVFLFGQRFDSRMLRFVRAVTDGRYRYIRNFHPHRHRGILAGYPHGQVGWQSFYALQQAGETNRTTVLLLECASTGRGALSIPSPIRGKSTISPMIRSTRRVLAKMRHVTLTKMREIRDTGLVPEAMYNELSAKGTVYDYVHDDAFPYDEVLKLALTAGNGQDKELPQLEKATHNDHPVVRYWGALGCTMRGKSAKLAATSLKMLLKDPVPAVRVAAAEALVAQGDTNTGLNALTTILGETEDDMVALEALNVVVALGLTEQIPKAVYARACKTGSYPGRMAEHHPDIP